MQKIKNKVEYDELIENIRECLEWHTRRNFNDLAYNLVMDNGEKIRIVFNNSSVAHLLGINTEYLKSTGMFNDNSYEILKQVCNNSYRLYNMINQGHLKYDSFISDYADEKVIGFKKICGIDLYNVEFICKYDKARSYDTGNIEQVADYYIAYRAENGLFVVGLKRNGLYYYPMTNRYVNFESEKDIDFLKALLKNQHITMPKLTNIYYFNTGTNSKPMYIDYHKKSSMLRTLNEYRRKYDAETDVLEGYQTVNEKLLRMFGNADSSNQIYSKGFERISKRCIIDIKELEIELGGVLPEEILTYINIYNNSINENIDAALDEHTKNIISERNKLSEENKKYIKKLEELKKELLQAKSTIQNLQKENLEYKSREQETVEAIKRIYKL